MRIIPALIVTTALVASLAACSTGDSAPAGCGTPAEAGKASTLVTASGRFGTALDVEFPTPLLTDGIEASVLEEGDGEYLRSGDFADLHLSIFDGETGEPVTVQGYDASMTLLRPINAEGGVFGRILECVPVGSRVAATLLETDIFNATGAAGEVPPTVVVVIDVDRGYPGKADGTPQLPQRGYPAVVLAPNGQPGITIPRQDPPAELGVTLLKKGDGEIVQEGDNLVVQYTGMTWAGESIFDSSWDRGTATEFLAQEGTPSVQGLIPGFAEAIIGASVGSQILAVVPPEDGYGDAPGPGIPAGSTLVFVIDILGIKN